MSVCQFLLRLASSDMAVNAFIGGLWSFAVEWWPQFGELGYKKKRLVILALCMVVPVGALVLAVVVYRCEGAALNRELLSYALAAGAISFMSSQVAQLRQ